MEFYAYMEIGIRYTYQASRRAIMAADNSAL